jgi:type IV secretion/conjugal transfer VirB4 family ATPase
MSHKKQFLGSLAGLVPLLTASEGLAASLRAAHARPDLIGTAALGGMIAAGAGAAALAAMPAVRRFVVPQPAETHLSDLLQFDRCEDGETIRTKDGALVQTVLLRGIDVGGMTGDELDGYLVRRKAWFEKISNSKLTIKLLTTRDLASYELAATYGNPMLQSIHDTWNEDFARVFVNRDVVVFSVPKDGRAERQILRDAVRDALDALAAYGPELLDNGQGEYSPLLTFWATLVNGFPTLVGSFTDRLSERLVANTVQFGPEEGLIRYIDGPSTLFAAALSLSEWGEESSGRIILDLLRLDGRVTVFQVVQGLDKAQAVFDLAKNSRQALLGFKNPFTSSDFGEAEANIQGDRASYLRHQLSIFLSAESREELERLITQARRVFLNYGVKPAIEGAAAEWLWRCRLPGFDTFVRPTNLLSHNLAHLCSFQREPAGLERCDWGEGPLRVFRTASGGAYAFQLHASDQKEALANSAVIAPAGSGKTTFFEHVIGGAMRHERLRAYIFDRFSGTRIFTQATGGTYIDLADAKSTQLNPLQADDTKENRAFVHQFLMQLAGVDDDDSREVVTRGVDAIFGVAKSKRSLNSVLQTGFDTGSKVKKGLLKWTGDSPNASWFNGERDSLDVKGARLVAFEMTEVQKEPALAAAMVTYIMHRIRQVVRAQALPHLIFIDETAPMLEDSVFRGYVAQLFREHRKLRGSINVCFQDAGALLKSPIAETVLNNCPTLILFPNANAQPEDYAALRLTSEQWAFVKGTSNLAAHLKRGVLIRRGNEAVFLDVDLSGLGPLLKLYRSGNEPLALMRQLQQEWGIDQWVGHYLDFA